MNSFNSIVIYVPVLGPVLLTLMGAIVSTRLLEPRQKKTRWRISFFGVGALSILGGIYSAHLAQGVMRGADYFYFMPDISSATAEGFEITARNPSDLPVYDAYAYIQNVDHDHPGIVAHKTPVDIGTLPPGFKKMKFRLPFGFYQIDLRTRYNRHKYYEMLKVIPFHGQIIGQSYIVTEVGTGKHIEMYTQPDDFPGTYPTEAARPQGSQLRESKSRHWLRPRELLQWIFKG